MNIVQKFYTIGIICLGASLGSTLRFMVYSGVGKVFQDTYFATVTVNIIGSFLIGILFVIFNEISSPRLQLLLITGLLASFTTFSTLSLDAIKLLTSGQIGLAIAHVSGQIIFGISFCYLGVKIGQKLL